MNQMSLYVTVTADCRDLANQVFPRDSEWEMVSEEYNGDGTGVLHFLWNGQMQTAIEQNLNTNRQVVSYQII